MGNGSKWLLPHPSSQSGGCETARFAGFPIPPSFLMRMESLSHGNFAIEEESSGGSTEDLTTGEDCPGFFHGLGKLFFRFENAENRGTGTAHHGKHGT